LETENMSAPTLDNEFLKYWLKLSVVEKESLLSVAKNYVQLKESEIEMSRKKIIMAERNSYLKGQGKNNTWEQVKDLARNKDRQNAL